MGRPRKWPPSVHPHRPSGQDRIRVAGVDYYLGPIGSEESRKEYARLVALLAPGEAGPPPPKPAPAGGPTVADVVARWLAEDAPRLPKDGREKWEYKRALAPVLALFGKLPACDFGRQQLKEVQMATASGSWMGPRERAKVKASGRPVGACRNVANRRIVRVRTVWRWAEGEGLVPEGSWGKLLALKGLARNDARVRQTERRKAARWEDALAVAQKCPPAPRAILLCMWYSGMRTGEARCMRKGEVDRSGPVWLYRPRVHKTSHLGHERVVPLGRKAQAVLRPWLDACKGPDDFVFPPRPRRKGRTHYTRHSLAQAVRRAAKAAGVAGFQLYQCRHSARRRIGRALGIEAARAVLGHATAAMTAQYDHGPDLALAVEAARLLG